MHKKIVILLSGKNIMDQPGLAKGSDWCRAGGKRALNGARLEKFTIMEYSGKRTILYLLSFYRVAVGGMADFRAA